MPGHACSSCMKRRGPSERSWTISGVHLAATSSAVRATAHSASCTSFIVLFTAASLPRRQYGTGAVSPHYFDKYSNAHGDRSAAGLVEGGRPLDARARRLRARRVPPPPPAHADRARAARRRGGAAEPLDDQAAVRQRVDDAARARLPRAVTRRAAGASVLGAGARRPGDVPAARRSARRRRRDRGALDAAGGEPPVDLLRAA